MLKSQPKTAYYLEFHNIYHNAKRGFYSKRLYRHSFTTVHLPRGLNNKTNRIHKRPLRIVYQDKDLQDLLQKNKSVSI